ncbi:glycosyltransferase family 4 protein [Sedimenticola selenatireducens]|uniref:Glycosyltransferase family 4 protein n=1 Tax=Sedimenticola selenatireducens TaxID=191960 RepID=A0A558DR73_9GAMM|nr:glycosyltransferase family 4 protein [Sedimenticola selenatireducens]TVO73577.1 glycosyltransferase family 4 protein [Sedimenticola selenatireducens]TVT63517.1 MAG: glycosyltransferase family 4 protein [Sedimenticola selenatireducens]
MDLVKPQSIALVGPLPPPFGGMANQTLQLAKLLEGEGVEVVLVRTNAPYRPKWMGRIKGVRALFRLIPYLLNIWMTLQKVQLVHLMANSGWSWHLFAAPVIWMAHLKKVPVVVNYRGGEANAFLTKSNSWVRPSLRRVAKVVVPSGFLAQVFASFDVASEVVPNIIDLDRFSSDEKRTLNKSSPHFIVCRNLEAIYDVETAIRAFSSIVASYPQARLTIAGEGPERSALEQRVKDLCLEPQVAFTGRLDPEKMASLYKSADVMLNTSRVDNMPNALLEAMSAGVPIVSTDAGGIPYMVENDQTALLRPVGDWQGIADAALMLLQQDTLYQRLSENGVEDVFRYRWKSVQPLWMAIYSEALGNKPNNLCATIQ